MIPWTRIDSARSARALRVKALSRLIQAGLHLGDGQRDGALPLGGQVRVAEQGVQPPAQAQSLWFALP